MEIKKNQTEWIEKKDLSPNSHKEVRSEARRRLIKAGLMSVPVMMTVQSRPLFAQSPGSTEALSYGGYDSVSQSDTIMPRTPDPVFEESIFRDTPSPPSTGGSTASQPFAPAPAYSDPYANQPAPSRTDDFSFTRSRDPRSRR